MEFKISQHKVKAFQTGMIVWRYFCNVVMLWSCGASKKAEGNQSVIEKSDSSKTTPLVDSPVTNSYHPSLNVNATIQQEEDIEPSHQKKEEIPTEIEKIIPKVVENNNGKGFKIDKIILLAKNDARKNMAVSSLSDQLKQGDNFLLKLKALESNENEKEPVLKANLSRDVQSMEKALAGVKEVVRQVANRAINLDQANERLQTIAQTIELVFEKVKLNHECESFGHLAASIKDTAYAYCQILASNTQK